MKRNYPKPKNQGLIKKDDRSILSRTIDNFYRDHISRTPIDGLLKTVVPSAAIATGALTGPAVAAIQTIPKAMSAGAIQGLGFGQLGMSSGSAVKDAAYGAAGEALGPLAGKAISKLPIKTKWLMSRLKNSTQTKGIDYSDSAIGDVMKIKDFLKEQFRRTILPETKNTNALSVVDDFYERIQTPEGLKRLKNLGIDESSIQKKVKVYEDPRSYGSYSLGRIYMNPGSSGHLSKSTIRHELEHHVQSMSGSPRTIIDDNMKKLDVRVPPTNPNWQQIKQSDKQFKQDVNFEDLKDFFNNTNQKSVDYFLTGSDGAESSAMLAEAQQYLIDNKFIKHQYDKITPDIIQNAHSKAYYDKEYPIRLFKIMKPTSENYKLMSDNLNKMLTTVPATVGANKLINKKEK